MDGIINIYKQPGMTSFSCVSQVRRIMGASKAGHAGTLDPEASGVLPVCLGKATKCADMFLTMDKSYTGEITFGTQTDTCDIWGQPVISLDKNDARLAALTKENIRKCAEAFLGETEQTPPDYAAVKINGVPAYRLARRGVSFEMKARQVRIYEISVISLEFVNGGYPKAVISVKCSRGTYIRSLFRDIGVKLGVYACMSALERTEYGFMKAENAVTPDMLKAHMLSAKSEGEDNRLAGAMYPIGYMLKDAPYIELDGKEARTYKNGKPLIIAADDVRSGRLTEGGRVRVYTNDGYLTAFARSALKDGMWEIKTEKFFDCKEDPYFERF